MKLLPLLAITVALLFACSTDDGEKEQPAPAQPTPSSSSSAPASYTHCIDDNNKLCYPTTNGNKCIFAGDNWTGIDRFGNNCPYDLDFPYVPDAPSSSSSTPVHSYTYCVESFYKVCYLAKNNDCATISDTKLDDTCPSSYYMVSQTNPSRTCFEAVYNYNNKAATIDTENRRILANAESKAKSKCALLGYSGAVASDCVSREMSSAYDEVQANNIQLNNLKNQVTLTCR